MNAEGGWHDPNLLYGAAVVLAAFAATSELIGRFRDAPLRVLIQTPGLVYVAMNGLLSFVVLLALRSGTAPPNAQTAWEQVLLAGFGARVIVRTKVVGYRTRDGKQHDVGPGAVFETILQAISRAADRDQAADRLALVRPLLNPVHWERARVMFVNEMAAAMQDLTDAEKQQISATLQDIASREADDSTRVDLLGFLILDFAGDQFLKNLVAEYERRFPDAPLPQTATGQSRGAEGSAPPAGGGPPDQPGDSGANS